MKHAAFAVAAGVVSAVAIVALRPAPTLAASATAKPLLACAYSAVSNPIVMDVGGGTNPNSSTLTQVGGTNCTNTVITIAKNSGHASGKAGLVSSSCTTVVINAPAPSSFDVWGCDKFGNYTIRVIDNGTVVQTFTLQVVE